VAKPPAPGEGLETRRTGDRLNFRVYKKAERHEELRNPEIYVSSRRVKSTRKSENDENACLKEERKTRGNRKSENPRVWKRKKRHAKREKM